MTNIARITFASAALAVTLAACSSPAPVTEDPNLVAAAVCVGLESPDDLEDLVDRDTVVVPDNYCPIGDTPVDGYPYWWAYSDALPTGSDLDVPFVGTTILVVDGSGHGWSRNRPARLRTLNISRGVFRDAPAAGQSSTRYSLAPLGNVTVRTPAAPTGSVQRGGLGVPNARATNAPVPLTAAARPVPAPRAPAPAQANTGRNAAAPAPAPAARVPARPSGPRPSAPSSGSTKSGRR